MNKRIGKASLGWLCLLAAGLWIAYKFEYFNLLLSAWTSGPVGEFDEGAESRVLLFILSPGIVLTLIGIVLIIRSYVKRKSTKLPTSGLPTM